MIKRCVVCNKIFLGITGIDASGDWVCMSCWKKHNSIHEAANLAQRKREQSGQLRLNAKSINIRDEKEALIQLDYGLLKKISRKVFYSKHNTISDFVPIFNKIAEGKTKTNLIHLKIEPVTDVTQISKLISGGMFDFRDDFTRGYTLIVSLAHQDGDLLKKILRIIHEKNFGCLSSDYSAHCHLSENEPNEQKAVEMMQFLKKRIEEEL